MAAPGGKYFIQDQLSRKFQHHNSFRELWETKWKPLAAMSIYPFMFGAIQDFEPIVEDADKKRLKEPYDWDEYAETFFPHAERLAKIAEEAEAAGEKAKASEYYLRSSAVYRIARFPAPRSVKQRKAWTKGKEVARKGLGLREHPIVEVKIPHTHALPSEGAEIPVFYHLPAGATSASPVPLVIIFTGLDGYRTELAVWMEGWRQCGCACMVVEIPGTGDSPADPADPTSPDRQWSSVLDWVAAQPGLDAGKVVVWAFSTGGFYAIRLAHTHADRVAGVAALGGGCHHMFDPEWLEASNHGEYPFDLGGTLCYKFGYGSDFERFKREARAKYSLLEDGTLDGPGCGNLLLVNGTEDSIYPIDDYYVAIQHGDPKLARFVPNTPHMGEPQSFFIILTWFFKLLGIDQTVPGYMKTLNTKPKY